MYYDLSIIPNNSIETTHLIKSLKESAYCAVAIDYHFKDTLVTAPP